jgi:CIC family chloride channel protein
MVFLAAFLHAGAYGGMFAPSLGIGVMSGFIFASGLNYLFDLSLDPVVFALVGMGGILAGINSIPLTSIMLVFEVTSDYRFILPLMLVSIMAYLVVVYMNKGTIYASELLEEGIDVSRMGEVDLLGQVNVKDLMKKDYETVSYRLPFQALLQELLRSRYGDVCVVDDNKHLMGVVSLKEVRQALINNELVDLLIAGDLIIPVPAVTADDQVSIAVQKIEKYDIENIPVVAEDGYTIIGMLRHQDILQAYSTLLEAWETDRFLSSYSFNRK